MLWTGMESRGADLGSILELDAVDDVAQQDGAIEPAPSLLCSVRKLEDHREAGSAGRGSFGPPMA